MLRKKEKQTLTRLFLLGVVVPIGLDRFYEGNVTGGFLALLLSPLEMSSITSS